MIFEIFTVIDITDSKITRNEKPQASNLTQSEWDFLRNQRRNWDVVIQLLGLRFQAEKISSSKIVQAYPPIGNHENQTVWRLSVEFEHEIPMDIFLEDFDNIPIIIGLGESASTIPIFKTSGKDTNIIFVITDK